ncbi:MAG: iron-sulfur cluster assembly accessory protein [Planctomycetes bacterium]|nr:iron-sulfur cluster assembly accessory protein [Planctomycetota bacterium]
MAIKLSARAAQELKTLMGKEVAESNMRPEAVLRLMVVGGGCSGFQYRMGFDEKVTPEDRVEEIEGVRVAVDAKSYLYLDGTEVDYQDGLMGRGFVFQNPNASGTCGCGSSFQV